MIAKVKPPRYETDEIVLGVVFTIVLHFLFIAPLVMRAVRPPPPTVEEKPLVERPFVAATLLKLGKPLDPTKMPDRFVPRARTAPKNEVRASREDPKKKTLDAGAPPVAAEGDLRLNAQNDPFAEDAGKDRPEIGHLGGVDGGTETDPSKVRAGDAYAALLGKFFHDRWTFPTTISQGEANRLCVSFQVNITTRMGIWYVKEDPVRRSGNDLFDDSARSMLQKLRDDHVVLPEPPPDVAALYKGRTLILMLSGAHDGDASRCK
jgi:hypothetical protein